MIPVVISGGSGTRLWPVSRSSYPKQFCEFYDKSFLVNSVERLLPLGTPYILTLENMRAMTLRALKEVEFSEDRLIAEPMGKNTAPAIALLCKTLLAKGLQSEVVGIFPADHLVTDSKKLIEIIKFAEDLASKGEVVTLGIMPKYPATGYGYVEVSKEQVSNSGQLEAFRVERFLEKPTIERAAEFVDAGNYLWNSGMFVFRVDVMIDHFKEYMPELWNHIEKLKADSSNAKHIYSNIESQSIDYGIMEKLSKQVCIPVQIGWSDVGSWDEIARIAEDMPDYRADSMAQIFAHEATSNFVFSLKDKVVGLIGVRNLIVVDTPDALLISKKGDSEKVREIVKMIQLQGLPQATDQKFEIRPWGLFEVLADADKYKAKCIKVDPGAQLSYQSHEKRAEHWIIIEGEAEVELDGQSKVYKEGDYVHIPRQAKHRIKNVGQAEVVFIEIQTGSYFGEDDIVRYADDYNRV